MSALWLGKRLPATKTVFVCLLAASLLLMAARLLATDRRPLRPLSLKPPPLQLAANASNFSDIGQHFFGAYFDTRASLRRRHFVRVLSVQDTSRYSGRLRCLLFDDSGRRSFSTPARSRSIGAGMPHGTSYFKEFVVSCEIGQRLSAAAFLVVQSERGDYRSPAIQVSHNPQSAGAAGPQKLLVNCVSLTFGRPSEYRLVEWLEAQRLLGMDKVVLHFHHVTSDKFQEVAAAYEKEGFVDIRRIPCPFCVRGQENRLGLLLMSPAINQCLYENLGGFNFTAVFDLDEIIVPQQHSSYSAMLAHLSSKVNTSSFAFHNWYHFSELGHLPQLPQYLYMLRHPYRLAKPSEAGSSTKSIHNSQHVVALHNHFTWENVPNAASQSKFAFIGTDIGINQHFKPCHYDKETCDKEMKKSQPTVNDRLNRLMGDELRAAVERRLRQLSLLPLPKNFSAGG